MNIYAKPYKPAQISKGKREWYIYYSYLNPDTGTYKLFKDRAGLNYTKDLKDRKLIAENLRDAYNERLKSGWSPFGEPAIPEYNELRFLPLIKIFDRIITTKQSTIKHRSKQSYIYSKKVLEKWLIKNKLQNLAIENFTPKYGRAFVDSLMEHGYANKTINNHVLLLKVLFNSAINMELIVKSPLAGIKKLPEQSGKNFAFSEVQKQTLKKKILEADPHMWLFVKFIYHLFIRPIELLRVRISDVDLRTSQVIVQSGAAKNAKQLPVQIPESFLDEIKALNLEQYPGEWFIFSRGFKPGPTSFSRNRATTRHTEILKQCDMTDKNLGLYSWKATGNIDAFLAGVDVYDLMRQNRHHSLDQTMTYLRSLGLRPNINFSKMAPKL